MFYYYGAKHQLAKHYPAPKHSVIIEPFAGSAGYSMYHLTKNPALSAILYEKDPRVVALWRKLLDMTPQQALNYPMPQTGSRTNDFLVMTCAAGNALAHSKTFKVTPRVQKIFNIMLRRIAKCLTAVSGRVTIVEGDYSTAENASATWFVDPPYQVPSDYMGKSAFPAGMGYAKSCDSSKIDYPKLGEWCRSRQGQVIACEYDAATWLPFVNLKRNKNTLGKIYQEGIWVN